MQQDTTKQTLTVHNTCVGSMHTGQYKLHQERSALAEIKRDEIKTKNMKRKRLLTKYNIEKEENLDHVMRELKLKVSKKTQRLFRYRKRQNQYYQNKICADRLKKFLQHSQTKKYQCEKCTH